MNIVSRNIRTNTIACKCIYFDEFSAGRLWQNFTRLTERLTTRMCITGISAFLCYNYIVPYNSVFLELFCEIKGIPWNKLKSNLYDNDDNMIASVLMQELANRLCYKQGIHAIVFVRTL